MRRLDDRFRLDLFLTDNDPDYLNELRAYAASDKRIHFRSPVPLAEICRTLNCYDMGILFAPSGLIPSTTPTLCPTSFSSSYRQGWQWPSAHRQDGAKFVNAYSLGVIAESFEPANLASALNAMCEADLVRYKLASNVAADSLNDEVGGRLFQQLVERLLSRRGQVANFKNPELIHASI